MKRVIVASILLLSIFTISLGSKFWIKDIMLQIENRLDLIQNYVDNENHINAQNSATELQTFYKKKVPILALFLKQDLLGNLNICLGGLNAYAVQDSEPDLYCEIDKTKAQLEVIRLLFGL